MIAPSTPTGEKRQHSDFTGIHHPSFRFLAPSHHITSINRGGREGVMRNANCNRAPHCLDISHHILLLPASSCDPPCERPIPVPADLQQFLSLLFIPLPFNTLLSLPASTPSHLSRDHRLNQSPTPTRLPDMYTRPRRSPSSTSP